MSYASVLVHVNSDPKAAHVVAAARKVADQFQAILIGLGAENFVPSIADSSIGYIGGGLVQAEREIVDQDLMEVKTRFEAATRGHPGVLWRSYLEFPDRAAAWAACEADLLVIGRRGAGSGDIVRCVDPGDIVMQAGRPVLVIPPGFTEITARSVLVAWKNTREARRAVADAIPFLQRAGKVVVVDVHQRNAMADPSLDAVIGFLQRHGVKAHPELVSADDGDVQRTLLRVAHGHQSDLIVAGAYGHTRFREWVFSGVTETLLTDCPIPVLLSH